MTDSGNFALQEMTDASKNGQPAHLEWVGWLGRSPKDEQDLMSSKGSNGLLKILWNTLLEHLKVRQVGGCRRKCPGLTLLQQRTPAPRWGESGSKSLPAPPPPFTSPLPRGHASQEWRHLPEGDRAFGTLRSCHFNSPGASLALYTLPSWPGDLASSRTHNLKIIQNWSLGILVPGDLTSLAWRPGLQ